MVIRGYDQPEVFIPRCKVTNIFLKTKVFGGYFLLFLHLGQTFHAVVPHNYENLIMRLHRLILPRASPAAFLLPWFPDQSILSAFSASVRKITHFIPKTSCFSQIIANLALRTKPTFSLSQMSRAKLV